MHNRILILLTSIGVALIHASTVWARAGGGGGYSSGGSSSSYSGGSSSYSGGSGGSGDFTIFDVIIIAIAIVFFLYGKKKVLRQSREAIARRHAESQAVAETIRARDAAFDLERFSARIRQAFLDIQQAWSDQNLDSVRGFMSDGLHERFSIQLREQKALGYRNQVTNVKIRECALVEAHALEHFDVVSVRISARASDVRIDSNTGREIADTRRVEHFTEIWSFLRGHDASGKSSGGLFEGQCPNCAAPIDPKRAWACESCGSDLDAAPPDWVLVEITQIGEWKKRSHDERDWLKGAVDRDPGLSEQQVEDRASVLFWRLMDAERMGSVGELASVARPDFLDAQSKRMAAAGERYLGDCAVGSVELRGIVPGPEWDLALVQIRWSGGTYLRRQKGRPKSTGSHSLRRSLLVMARRAGATSSVGRCIVSAHCHRCGAPDEGSIEAACTFCGEPLNDGSDWLIDRFPYMNDSDAMTLLAELNRPNSPAREGADGISSALDSDPTPGPSIAPRGLELYAWGLKLAYADRNIDRRERRGLEKLALRLGIPKADALKLRQAAQFERLEVESPIDANEARIWVEQLRAIAEADGRLHRAEREILENLANHTSG